MAIPELNRDILGLIFDLLGDQVTYISSELREKYFKKNGIWLHFRDFEKDYITEIPEKFYEYSVNLNFHRSSIRYCLTITFMETFRRYCGDKVANWILNNTICTKHLPFNTCEMFPNLIRVRKNNLDLLDDKALEIINFKGLTGFRVIVHPSIIPENLSRIATIDYKLICHTRITDSSWKVSDKIYDTLLKNINETEYYPKLKTLNVRGSYIGDRYIPSNFPKLRCIQDVRIDDLSRIGKVFPSVTILLIRNLDISEEDYKKLLQYNYLIDLRISLDVMLDKLVNLLEMGEKYGGGKICITYYPNPSISPKLVKRMVKSFDVRIEYKFCNTYDMLGLILDELLTITTFVGKSINVRNIMIERVMIGKILELHKKNGIFLNCGRAPPIEENAEYNSLRRYHIIN